MTAYSLRLQKISGCTHYIAVSWCWSDSTNHRETASRPRVPDPSRPEIELDLDTLQAATPAPGWDFYNDIPKLQVWAVPSRQTQRWASNLKFLTPGDHDAGCTPIRCPDCVGHLRHSVTRFHHKLASMDVSNDAAVGTVSVAGCEKGNKAPRSVLDRVVRFAAAHSIGAIWIDKDCIDQDNRDDKEAGIQSMDLVYQRSRYPLGIISDVKIRFQNELDAMAKMMSNQDLDIVEWETVTDILTRISSSKFFTRAWICQELVASGCMTLLILCDPSLYKNEEVLGSTRGEVEIRLDASTYGIQSWARLHELIENEFEIASDEYMKSEDELTTTENERFSETPDKMLRDLDAAYENLRSYSTGNRHLGHKNFWGEDKDPNWRLNLNIKHGLEHLVDKTNSVSTERLTILANICNFRVKLNTRGLAGFQFSTCLLALAIMNNHWTFFDPMHCKAITEIEPRDPPHKLWKLSDDQRYDLELAWNRDDKNVMVNVVHWIGMLDEGRTTQTFLTSDHNRVICKGRLWVTTALLDLRSVQTTTLAVRNVDDNMSSRQASKHFFWSLVKQLWQADLRTLAVQLWDDVKNDDKSPEGTTLTQRDCRTSVTDSDHLTDYLKRYKEEIIPSQQMRDDLAQTHVWLQQRIIEEGYICIAKLMSTDFTLIPNDYAFTDVRGTGFSVFECLTVGSETECRPRKARLFWKVRSSVFKWESEERMNMGTNEKDTLQPSKTDGYVLKRFNAGGLDAGGWPTEISKNGPIASAQPVIQFMDVMEELVQRAKLYQWD